MPTLTPPDPSAIAYLDQLATAVRLARIARDHARLTCEQTSEASPTGDPRALDGVPSPLSEPTVHRFGLLLDHLGHLDAELLRLAAWYYAAAYTTLTDACAGKRTTARALEDGTSRWYSTAYPGHLPPVPGRAADLPTTDEPDTDRLIRNSWAQLTGCLDTDGTPGVADELAQHAHVLHNAITGDVYAHPIAPGVTGVIPSQRTGSTG